MNEIPSSSPQKNLTIVPKSTRQKKQSISISRRTSALAVAIAVLASLLLAPAARAQGTWDKSVNIFGLNINVSTEASITTRPSDVPYIPYGYRADYFGFDGANGRDAFIGVFEEHDSDRGGPGSPGGKLSLRATGDITTLGANAWGLGATSVGGNGGEGGDGSAVRSASVGGNGGNGGFVSVLTSENVVTFSDGSIGILASSLGGNGGDGGDGTFTGGGFRGGAGGVGGAVLILDLDDSFKIETQGRNAPAVWGFSAGGGAGEGGGGGWASGSAGNGGVGENGGNVNVRMGLAAASELFTFGDDSHAIFAQSIGGFGGQGGDGIGAFVGSGGSGNSAGSGGTVSVTAGRIADIFTDGARSHGVLAQSVGGGGGSGGSGVGLAGYGAGGNYGGAGGLVSVFNLGRIRVFGPGARGIFAQSIGGGGGDGGNASGLGSSAGNGGGTSHGGAVTVSNTNSVQASSNAIFAESVGGGGGNGGSSTGWFSIGGKGGGGGNGAPVKVTSDGTLTTTEANASAILAQSVGGGGGNGGGSIATGVSVAVAIGGDGGGGGFGGMVNVGGTSEGERIAGGIETGGDNSNGILAQSVGGGGGNGGFATSFAVGKGASAALSLGGSGGIGNAGAPVSVNFGRDPSNDSISTTGKHANGIFAQSVGGGGGSGGMSIAGAASDGYSVALGMGGKGGAGGDGNQVDVSSGGRILTGGEHSYGILAQSVGGGGGNGGASVAGTASISGGLAMSFGGKGAGGGNGNLVNVTTRSGSSIETSKNDSHAIFAQSVGGGGGSGGTSVAGSVSTGLPISLSFGGSGGVGGEGGQVWVNHLESSVETSGVRSHGILAQSVGGGGGDGGASVAGGISAGFNVQLSLGGKGGSGGTGNQVVVDNASNITTLKDKSNGIFAQSAGGGGGSGGISVAGGISNGPASIGVALGGTGGNGNTGGDVFLGLKTGQSGDITTFGAESAGVFLQSVGGGGGAGGFSASGAINVQPGSKSLSVSLAGGGGNGNLGGNVSALNLSSATIATSGEKSPGIHAQSVGGGGGTGGMSIAGSLSMGGPQGSMSVSLPVAVGGGGGDGNGGGNLNIVSLGAITTAGKTSPGILAQSVGGGGGDGGSSLGISLGLQANSEGKKILGNVSVGGTGGDGNHGGSLVIFKGGPIEVAGDRSAGIDAQSIGGGGGKGGSSRTFTFNAGRSPSDPDNIAPIDGKKSNYQATVSVGGNGGGASDGGTVILDNHDNITTSGAQSAGIRAQSIGGGGGSGGDGIIGTGTLADLIQLKSATSFQRNLKLAVGGSEGSSGDGKLVRVTHVSGEIVTNGVQSYGILAQSIGGGGGIASHWIQAVDPASGGKATIMATGTVGIGGAAGASGNGSNVTVNLPAGELRRSITTSGNAAAAIFAQSVGGGGGVAGDVDRAVPVFGSIGIGAAFGRPGGDGGDGGIVAVDSDGDISTVGVNAPGIHAQSVGGGGGVASGTDGLTPAAMSGSVGGAGSAGKVTVTHAGTINTLGSRSHGIFAQSAGGKGTGANVAVSLSGGEIKASGDGSHGIFAQSRGNAGHGRIDVTNDGSVEGGTGDGAGVRLKDANYSLVTNNGIISSGSGVDGWAVYAEQDSATVRSDHYLDNYGTITGKVRLNSSSSVAGEQTFVIRPGGVLNSGSLIDLGAGNTFHNAGLISPGGDARRGATRVIGKLSQFGAATWNVDVDTGVADAILFDGVATLGGHTNTINLTNLGSPAVGTTYNLISAASGLSTGTFQLGDMTGNTGPGVTYQLIGSDTRQQLSVTESTGDFYWAAGAGHWRSSRWTRDITGTNVIHGTPGPGSDVYFSNTSGEIGLRNTSLGEDFTINSLTFNDPNGVSIFDESPRTLTILGEKGIDVQASAFFVDIFANVLLSGEADTITVSTQTGLGMHGVIGGSNGLTKAGLGPLRLRGRNNYSGGTTISSGRLLVEGNGRLGSGPVINNGSLEISSNWDHALSHPISGTGALRISGSAKVTLTSANTYTGDTSVSGTVLRVNNESGSGTGTGAVTVIAMSNGHDDGRPGILSGDGSIFGPVTIYSGGHLSPGDGIGSLDVGSLALKPGSFLDFELGSPGLPGINSDLITVTDGLTIEGGSFAFTDAGGLDVGTYTLIDYAGMLGGDLTNFATPIGPGDFIYTLLNNAADTSIDLSVSLLQNLDCNGDGVVNALDLDCACSAGSLGAVLTATNLPLGDLNADGAVAFADFLVLSGAFGNDGTYQDGDLDCSGNVGFADFLLFSSQFGKTTDGASSVPEPTNSCLMITIVLSAVLHFCRKRRGCAFQADRK